MISIDAFKKETVKIPLLLYLLILVIFKVSHLLGFVKVDLYVELFSVANGVVLIMLYFMYQSGKISYNIFIYIFIFSIFVMLNFVLYYNTHVIYRSMWVIALIPFVLLYAGRVVGILFAVYFLVLFIIEYVNGFFPGLSLQDVYVFVLSDIMVVSISYFFVLNLEKYASIIEKEHKNLTAQAYTDALTGVFNRRGFEKAIVGKSGVLGIFDLDYFKDINDTFGHEFGDEYLKFFVRVLRSNLRRNDIIGRIGGDEFVVLFVDSEVRHIRVWAEKFYEMLKRKKFKNIMISVSSGFYTFEGDFKESFVHADELLYVSKRKKGIFTFPDMLKK